MRRHLVTNQWHDYFIPGEISDTRLLHSDISDQIRVCPSQFGQGYIQKIHLREDLVLQIIDYTPNHNLLTDSIDGGNCVEFEFQLAGRDAGYSFFFPHSRVRYFNVIAAQQRIFKVEVFFKAPSFCRYCNQFIECLSPPLQQLLQEIIQSIHHYQVGRYVTSTATLEHIINCTIPSGELYFEQIIPAPLYTQSARLESAIRNPITLIVREVIEQILSCPYGGSNRRRYLEWKALQLVDLHFYSLLRSQRNCHELPLLQSEDAIAIHQAEEILRTNLQNPPSIELLARSVLLNRFKINQGFLRLYNTTPFRYLRKCRMLKAKHLLMTSELSIEQVAASVG
ncbi:helix-turn-helix transcriptional regulator [Calothrix rhizosoleniae]|uniref:helix-turn-helix transcriptional regulator n=1 Tax=Calothrix rhizosoleniae TaxID=888997 RepID=UPI000B49803D|nr:AraC family transcriptional regulator [Calothrix rhizosoleniae]